MWDENKLFNFMLGLQSRALKELQRQAVRVLLATITVANGLVDFIFVNVSLSECKKSKDGKQGNFSCDGGKKITAQIKPSKTIRKERRVQRASFATDHIGQRIIRSMIS